jgi:hypothetical protein
MGLARHVLFINSKRMPTKSLLVSRQRYASSVKPTRPHADQVAANLHGVAASVKVVQLPGLPEKGDISDWLDQGHTLDELWSIVLAAPEWKPSKPSEKTNATPWRQSGRTSNQSGDLDTIPLPEPVAWPSLDEHAYHGLAGEIVKAIEPETESDPVAVLVQVLLWFGNLIGRDAHFLVEGTKHFANLFVVLVGETARGRKGTSEGRVRQVFGDVDEQWVRERIASGLVSGEGLIWWVRDPIYTVENIKEKGRIVGTQEVLADPGIEDKRLLVVESEFASVLRVCRRETNMLSPTMRSAWDSGILRTMAKNSPAKATDAHISIVGHIVFEELREALSRTDGFNGFANRFLWVAVRRSKLLPDGGQDLDLSSYAHRLAMVANAAQAVQQMYRDRAAAALWRKVYAELADSGNYGLVAAVTNRAEAQVLRLSMVYALLDGSAQIREKHLLAAMALWRYCQQSARLIFGGAGENTFPNRVLEIIRQHPDGITRTGIYDELANHVKGAALVHALARLRDSGKVCMVKVETGGRPAELWYPRGESELSEQSLLDSESTPQQSPLSSLGSHHSHGERETEVTEWTG